MPAGARLAWLRSPRAFSKSALKFWIQIISLPGNWGHSLIDTQIPRKPVSAPRWIRPWDRFGFPDAKHIFITHNVSMALCVAGLLSLLTWGRPTFAHEHPRDNSDSQFLDTLERPDNAANPSRDPHSRLCCTNKDAVKVDYELVLPSGGKYPEPDWYVWIDLDGTGLKRVHVPPEKIVTEYAPSGQAYVFVLGQTIQCFVRPLPRT
jgi:hypothetical protein